jgi:hypothetical protein
VQSSFQTLRHQALLRAMADWAYTVSVAIVFDQEIHCPLWTVLRGKWFPVGR